MDLSSDTIKIGYYGISAAFVALLGWNGWRQGFARQFMTLVSIACAYTAAWFVGPSAAPVFGFLKYPPQVTALISSAAVGITTFLALHGLRMFLVKRTAQHKNATVRLSYGILGAFINVVFGSLLFLLTTGAIRAISTVAQSRVEDHDKEVHESPKLIADDPGPLVRSFAKLGTALEEGKSGEFLQRYDKVPAAHVFTTLAKLGIMVSRPEAVERFLAYPGVASLAHHPKLVAVRNDPSVAELLNNQSFIKLLRHEKVIALANDEEFNALIKTMEFDKALDHAMKGAHLPDKAPGPAPAAAPN